MSVLFIKHIDIEGPGTMLEYINTKAIQYKIIDLSLGDNLPSHPNEYEAIVILGGPMNVFEEDKHNYLKDEDIFIKEALKERVPMLGLCLGAQLIAKATGAKVKKSPGKEIGWFKVSLTNDGLKDSIFNGLEKEIEVFQWHGDTFEIPDNGLHLASSSACDNQAFKYNSNVYGFQFHLEVTKNMVKEWLDAYSEEILSMGDKVNKEGIIERANAFAQNYNCQAQIFYNNFFKIAKII